MSHFSSHFAGFGTRPAFGTTSGHLPGTTRFAESLALSVVSGLAFGLPNMRPDTEILKVTLTRSVTIDGVAMTVGYNEIRDYLETLYPGKIRKKRIRAIKVNSGYHWQPQLLIEVGKSYRELEPGAPLEKVIAIFESDSFLVCTEKRGGGKGIPYYFTREDVRQVFEYE